MNSLFDTIPKNKNLDFLKLLDARRSTRAFTKEKITDDKLKAVLDAARRAPSAGNLQAYRIFVIRNDGDKKRLAKAAFGQSFIAQAPVVLVFAADPNVSAVKYGDRGRGLYCIQDATLAASFAWLAAVNAGLAAAWVGALDEDEVRRVLGINKRLRPLIIMPIGYAAENPPESERQ